MKLHILKSSTLKGRFFDNGFTVCVLSQHLIQDVTKFCSQQIFRDDRGDQNSVFYDGNHYPDMLSLVAKCRTMNKFGLEG
jgi:hypothetical protein